MKLAEPIAIRTIRTFTDHAQQLMVNAAIDLPEYSNPEFRAQQISNAISTLQILEQLLQADAVLLNMRKVKDLRRQSQ